MASSAASSSMSPAASSFGRLLKSSKVIAQFDPSIPLVYTSYGGSKKRSDYGLKRALPKIKTPAIRVHSIDSSLTKLTDFDYAAKEYTFVHRIKESNVKISGPSYNQSAVAARERMRAVGHAPGGSAWDKEGFESVKDLKERVRTGKSKAQGRQSSVELASRSQKALMPPNSSDASSQVSESSSSSAPSTSSPLASNDELPQFPPDYLSMSPSEFDKLLGRLDELRPAFLEHLRERLQSTDPTKHFLLDVWQVAQTRDPAELGQWIDEFLAKNLPSGTHVGAQEVPHDPSLDRIQRQEHIAFGLTYAPPNLYMSDRATRALPARVLDNMGDAKGSAFGNHRHEHKLGRPTSVLGAVTATDLGVSDTPTAWHLDDNGDSNLDFGRTTVRVEHAQITHPSNVRSGTSVDEELYGVETQQVNNPSKRPSILDMNTFHAKLYRDGEQKGSLARQRIGSPEWVAYNINSTRDKSTRGRPLSAEYTDKDLRRPQGQAERWSSSHQVPGRGKQNITERERRANETEVDELLSTLSKFKARDDKEKPQVW